MGAGREGDTRARANTNASERTPTQTLCARVPRQGPGCQLWDARVCGRSGQEVLHVSGCLRPRSLPQPGGLFRQRSRPPTTGGIQSRRDGGASHVWHGSSPTYASACALENPAANEEPCRIWMASLEAARNDPDTDR